MRRFYDGRRQPRLEFDCEEFQNSLLTIDSAITLWNQLLDIVFDEGRNICMLFGFFWFFAAIRR